MASRIDGDPRALVAANAKRNAAKPTKNGGLTRRVRAAIEFLVFGIPDDVSGKAVTLERAAEAARLTPRAVRYALQKPAVTAFYRQAIASLRDGERAASIRTAIEIRDDQGLKASAAGQRVRLLAAQHLESLPDESASGPALTINVMPGYVLDLREPQSIDADAARPIRPPLDARRSISDEPHPLSFDERDDEGGWGEKREPEVQVLPHARVSLSNNSRGEIFSAPTNLPERKPVSGNLFLARPVDPMERWRMALKQEADRNRKTGNRRGPAAKG